MVEPARMLYSCTISNFGGSGKARILQRRGHRESLHEIYVNIFQKEGHIFYEERAGDKNDFFGP